MNTLKRLMLQKPDEIFCNILPDIFLNCFFYLIPVPSMFLAINTEHGCELLVPPRNIPVAHGNRVVDLSSLTE